MPSVAFPILLVFVCGIVTVGCWNPLSALFTLNNVAPSSKSSPYTTRMSTTWEAISAGISATPTGRYLESEFSLRRVGRGSAHTDNDLRLFGLSDGESPRVIFYKDRASWCPYCQKLWILLEEKRIPYKVEKINMRSYGDKPQEFLRLCPNGLLPAIRIDDGPVQTESLQIMLTLERTFTGPEHKPMWPRDSATANRAERLMKLERALFSDWCNLVFRGGGGAAAIGRFENTLMSVDRELQVTSSPWFLDDLSIVDLTFITHVERMCASVLFWSGKNMRGDSRWPNIERWIDAFEAMPSYLATKSDYYTHVMDIPPQYGPGNSLQGSEGAARHVLGEDGSWELPLPNLTASDLEPIKKYAGEEVARHEAAYKLGINHANIVKFACRGPGSPGKKQFSAPLADPYATPNLDYSPDVDAWLRAVGLALLSGNTSGEKPAKIDGDETRREGIQLALAYLRDRVGVPRDMSYPAARQLRAHLNWAIVNC